MTRRMVALALLAATACHQAEPSPAPTTSETPLAPAEASPTGTPAPAPAVSAATPPTLAAPAGESAKTPLIMETSETSPLFEAPAEPLRLNKAAPAAPLARDV